MRLGPFTALAILLLASGCLDSAPPRTVEEPGGTDVTPPVSTPTPTPTPTSTTTPSPTSFTVSGTVYFDWVPAKDNVTEGGVRLDYAGVQSKPARRVRVDAIQSSTSAVLASTTTNDLGAYSLTVSAGSSVRVRVYAQMQATNSVSDGTAPDDCSGASWNVKVVDNTANKALYALTSSSVYSSTSASVNFTPRITRSAGRYTDRSAAPFALLDTIVRELELVCQSNPSQNFPEVKVNWSANNIAAGDGSDSDKALGKIVTSHYTEETDGPNLYILGKEDNDTDEFDDHVIAHEFGHYLEATLYRADSIGGSHSLEDMLDPRVAFGEGYGNAISAMTFSDPIYVDTAGTAQATGFTLDVGLAPVGHDRSVFSETSAQYFLWKLFVNRSNSYARIHTVLAQDHTFTPAFTSLLSFAAYYASRFGLGAEQLSTLWGTTLATPVNALCVGSCSGSGDVLDLYDSDGDIGAAYATGRRYPVSGGSTYAAGFWNLYLNLSSGTNSSDHNRTASGGYSVSSNKMGMVRWYRYKNAGATKTVTISVPSIPGVNCSTQNALDMIVWRSGDLVNYDFTSSGCPSVSFSAQSNVVYTMELRARTSGLSGFSILVSP